MYWRIPCMAVVLAVSALAASTVSGAVLLSDGFETPQVASPDGWDPYAPGSTFTTGATSYSVAGSTVWHGRDTTSTIRAYSGLQFVEGTGGLFTGSLGTLSAGLDYSVQAALQFSGSIAFWSAGPDGTVNTADDFQLGGVSYPGGAEWEIVSFTLTAADALPFLGQEFYFNWAGGGRIDARQPKNSSTPLSCSG